LTAIADFIELNVYETREMGIVHILFFFFSFIISKRRRKDEGESERERKKIEKWVLYISSSPSPSSYQREEKGMKEGRNGYFVHLFFFSFIKSKRERAREQKEK